MPKQLQGVCSAKAVAEKDAANLKTIKGWLYRQNLHVVTAAEKAVLDACKRVDWSSLMRQWAEADVWPNEDLVKLADGVLQACAPPEAKP